MAPSTHQTTGKDDYMPEESETVYDPIIPLFREWAMLKHRVEEDSHELAILRDECIAAVEARGERDHKGSQYISLPFAIGPQEFTRIKRERRVSEKTDEEVAELITRAKGVYEKCFPLIPTLDQDELYVQYQLGVLSEEDLSAIFVQVESFSFKPMA
jgi:hypothetical protein